MAKGEWVELPHGTALPLSQHPALPSIPGGHRSCMTAAHGFQQHLPVLCRDCPQVSSSACPICAQGAIHYSSWSRCDKCFPEISSKCPFAEPASIHPSCTTGQSSSLCQKNYNSAPRKEETELLISLQVCRALPGWTLPLVNAAHFWMEGECLHQSGPQHQPTPHP